MAKHVYPPWFGVAQKCIFGAAVVLCIVIPVMHGLKRPALSSTAVILVLVLYFAAWLAFTLLVRFCIPSYTVESSLPIHTPLPTSLPRIIHTPAGRDAVPSAPAIRIHSPALTDEHRESAKAIDALPGKRAKGARFAEIVDSKSRVDRESQEHQFPAGKVSWPSSANSDPPDSPTSMISLQQQQYQQSPQSSSPSTPPSSPRGVVTFQTRPRGLTTDSTNSDVYPTFATYRQAQHADFGAFAQRIRRALENANVNANAQATSINHSLVEPQEQVQLQQQKQNSRDVGGSSPLALLSNDDHGNGQDGDLVVTPSVQIVIGEDQDSSPSPIPAALAEMSDVEATKMGHANTLQVEKKTRSRPRSSSAASMISTLSERIRLGFGKNMSGVGNDENARPLSVASLGTGTAGAGAMSRNSWGMEKTSLESNGTEGKVSEPKVEQEDLPSSSTIVGVMASAVAVASAMTLPRSHSTKDVVEERGVERKKGVGNTTVSLPNDSDR